MYTLNRLTLHLTLFVFFSFSLFHFFLSPPKVARLPCPACYALLQRGKSIWCSNRELISHTRNRRKRRWREWKYPLPPIRQLPPLDRRKMKDERTTGKVIAHTFLAHRCWKSWSWPCHHTDNLTAKVLVKWLILLSDRWYSIALVIGISVRVLSIAFAFLLPRPINFAPQCLSIFF